MSFKEDHSDGSATRRFVKKSYVLQHLRESTKVFGVCPNEYGICPYIIVDDDRVTIGGWSAVEEKDGVDYLNLRPKSLFDAFLEISDGTKVEEVQRIIKSYRSKEGLWRRLLNKIGRKTERIGAQPFFDDAVSQTLSICGVTQKDFNHMKGYLT